MELEKNCLCSFNHHGTRFDYLGYFSFDYLKVVILPSTIERIQVGSLDTTRTIVNDDSITIYDSFGLMNVLIDRNSKHFFVDSNHRLISKEINQELFPYANYIDENIE